MISEFSRFPLFSFGGGHSSQSTDLGQEMEKQNLEDAEKEEESSSSSSSDSDSSDKSSTSNIGLKTGKAADAKRKAKAAPKKRQKKETEDKGDISIEPDTPATTEESQQAISSAESKKPENEQTEKPEKPEKPEGRERKLSDQSLTEKAQSLLKSLEEVQGWQIFSGNVKEKDLNSRVQWGLDIAGKCEERSGNGLPDLAIALDQEANRVSTIAEFFQKLNALMSGSASEPANLKEFLLANCRIILEHVLGWETEQCTTFLTDLGKKLCEVLFATSGLEMVFFHFISVNKLGSWEGFGLHLLRSARTSIRSKMLRCHALHGPIFRSLTTQAL